MQGIVEWKRALQERANQPTTHSFEIKYTTFHHVSLLFNKKNKKISKYTVFLEYLVITSYKNDYFISLNTGYFFVWTKYTCMVETFEILIIKTMRRIYLHKFKQKFYNIACCVCYTFQN